MPPSSSPLPRESESVPVDRNSLAFWFPKIERAGLKVPRTIIVHTEADLFDLLDGKDPVGFDGFMRDLRAAGDEIGWPCFLRTGHGSGKHDWANTCHVTDRDLLEHHVAALVEWSMTVDFMGLPTDVWAVRELIPTAPLFVCDGYRGFPVTREFRMFVRDGKVEHTQPYWPPDAVEQGRPDAMDWAARLEVASKATQLDYAQMLLTAAAACDAVGGGYWSVDLLQDRHGAWWLTDMAEGDQSFKWEAAAA